MRILNGIRSGSAAPSLFNSCACWGGLWTAAELWFRFFLEGTAASASRLRILIQGVIGRIPCRFFYLHVFLCSNESIPRLGDIILYQMLVEIVGDLQSLMNAAVATSSLQLYTKAIWL